MTYTLLGCDNFLIWQACWNFVFSWCYWTLVWRAWYIWNVSVYLGVYHERASVWVISRKGIQSDKWIHIDQDQNRNDNSSCICKSRNKLRKWFYHWSIANYNKCSETANSIKNSTHLSIGYKNSCNTTKKGQELTRTPTSMNRLTTPKPNEHKDNKSTVAEICNISAYFRQLWLRIWCC